MLFNQENALYIYKYLMTQELSLHNNYPTTSLDIITHRQRPKPFLISQSFSWRNVSLLLHKWNCYFTLRNVNYYYSGYSGLHVGLFIMSEWPCLLLNAADDRIIMIMRTDCQVCAARNKSNSGSAFDKWFVLCALRFMLMYLTY